MKCNSVLDIETCIKNARNARMLWKVWTLNSWSRRYLIQLLKSLKLYYSFFASVSISTAKHGFHHSHYIFHSWTQSAPKLQNSFGHHFKENPSRVSRVHWSAEHVELQSNVLPRDLWNPCWVLVKLKCGKF